MLHSQSAPPFLNFAVAQPEIRHFPMYLWYAFNKKKQEISKQVSYKDRLNELAFIA